MCIEGLNVDLILNELNEVIKKVMNVNIWKQQLKNV